MSNADELLKKAESLDYFFDTISKNTINKKSRDGLVYVTADKVAKPWIMDTQIITMHPTAEGGMPHTRPPNIICMPVYYPESARDETLKHELIHVDQRRRPNKWQVKFERDGWSRLDSSEVPARWEQRCRLNPDTVDQQFWAWQEKWVPLPLFQRTDNPQIREITVKWWDREDGSLQNEAPRSLIRRYGNAALKQPEHPRELAAVELAHRFNNPSDIDDYLDS